MTVTSWHPCITKVTSRARSDGRHILHSHCPLSANLIFFKLIYQKVFMMMLLSPIIGGEDGGTPPKVNVRTDLGTSKNAFALKTLFFRVSS